MTIKASDNGLKRVYVEGDKFKVDGKDLWINGTNTPWHKWNDFGGDFDSNWWNSHFALLSSHGLIAVS